MGHFTCFSVLRSAPSILHCDNDVGGKKEKEEEVQSIEKKKKDTRVARNARPISDSVTLFLC